MRISQSPNAYRTSRNKQKYQNNIRGYQSPHSRNKSPNHVINLRPKGVASPEQRLSYNTDVAESINVYKSSEQNKVDTNLHQLKNSIKSKVQGFNSGSQRQYNQHNIQWKSPPPEIKNAFADTIFNQPMETHEFPSPYIKYKIIPQLDDKKCLDLTTIEDPKKNLKKNYLQIWKYHGGPNQQFYINKDENMDNKYYIISVSKGFTVEVPEFSNKEGAHIHANPKNQTENEHWQLREISDGSYEIISFCNKLLDVQNQSSSSGVKVIQWQRNGGKNQRWKIVPA